MGIPTKAWMVGRDFHHVDGIYFQHESVYFSLETTGGHDVTTWRVYFVPFLFVTQKTRQSVEQQEYKDSMKQSKGSKTEDRSMRSSQNREWRIDC